MQQVHGCEPVARTTRVATFLAQSGNTLRAHILGDPLSRFATSSELCRRPARWAFPRP